MFYIHIYKGLNFSPAEENGMKHDNKLEKGACEYYHCGKTRTLSIAIATAVVCGLGTLVIGLLAAHNSGGLPVVQMVGTLYHGYVPTVAGSFIGGLWGLGVGFVTGLVFGSIYNCCKCCLRCKCHMCCSKDKTHK